MLQQVAPVGMVAFALTFLLIVGEFDLSGGALFVLTGVLAAKLQPHFGTWPALLLAILAATAGGLFNGLLVSYARINSFVCTLGHEPHGRRARANVITKGFLRHGQGPLSARWAPTSCSASKYSMWILLVAAFACGFVLSRRRSAAGSTPWAATPRPRGCPGINTER